MVNQLTLEIIAAACGQGRMHDFRLFKEDYAGMAAHVRGHANSEAPAKKSKPHPLAVEQKNADRELARQSIFCEHIIGRLKIFRILSERYRNRRKRFCLRFNPVAAVYSFELQARS